MKNSKICLVILCLLGVSPAGTPRSDGATFCMENEIWKDIPGLSGMYQASTEGRIRSLDRIVKRNSIKGDAFFRGKIIQGNMNSSGYLQFGYRLDGKRFYPSVHRLVASTWIPNPFNLPVINHDDGIKTHNWITNLVWCTHVQNTRHAWDHGLNESPLRSAARHAKPVFDSVSMLGYGCLLNALDARGLTPRQFYVAKSSGRNLGITFIECDNFLIT